MRIMEIDGNKLSEHYDCCILGEANDGRIIYSTKKIVKIIQSEGLDYYDAVDFFNRHTTAFFNDPELDPIFLMDLD